jgi:hypothetical protein
LTGAQLQGAVLTGARLQGTLRSNAQFQGASLVAANLQAALLTPSWLQGVDLRGSQMDFALMTGANVWRASDAKCQTARIAGHSSAHVIKPSFTLLGFTLGAETATPDSVKKFVEEAVADIPDAAVQEAAPERMLQALLNEPVDETKIAENWRACAAAPFDLPKFAENRAKMLVELVCSQAQDGPAIVNRLATKPSSGTSFLTTFFKIFDQTSSTSDGQLGVALLQALKSEVDNGCPVMKGLDKPTKRRIIDALDTNPRQPPVPAWDEATPL